MQWISTPNFRCPPKMANVPSRLPISVTGCVLVNESGYLAFSQPGGLTEYRTGGREVYPYNPSFYQRMYSPGDEGLTARLRLQPLGGYLPDQTPYCRIDHFINLAGTPKRVGDQVVFPVSDTGVFHTCTAPDSTRLPVLEKTETISSDLVCPVWE